MKKAAKDVTIIGGGDKDGPALPVIVRQWKKFTAERVKLEKASTPYVWHPFEILGPKLMAHSQ